MKTIHFRLFVRPDIPYRAAAASRPEWVQMLCPVPVHRSDPDVEIIFSGSMTILTGMRHHRAPWEE